MNEHKIVLTQGGAARMSGGILRLGYEGRRGADRLRVELRDEWKGLTVRACWHLPGGDPPASLVENGVVEVPEIVTAKAGTGCVTFEGSNGNRTVTSADVHFCVAANSGTEDGTIPRPGTPAWQAFLDKAGNVQLHIGTVSSGDQASASITDGRLDLVLPKGEKGDNGDTSVLNAALPFYPTTRLGCVGYADVPGCDYAQIIIYGQSLASGTESAVALTAEPKEGVYMVGDQAHHAPDNPVTTGLYPCKNTGYESPIVAAAHHFAAMYHRHRDPKQKFIANSIGLGGRSIERLSKGCTSYGYEDLYQDRFLDYLTDTRTSVEAEGKTVKCIAIVFMQGEYNYDGYNTGQGFVNGTDGTTDKDEYKARLHQLKKDMQADIMAAYGQSEPPLFFVYQTGGKFITNGTSSINMAQQEMTQECDDAILLGSAMPCPRFNGGHMTSNGYRWQGEMIGKQLAETFLWGYGAQTITARKLTVEDNKVHIDYEVPVPPLIADGYTVQPQPALGFAVAVDGVAVEVQKAEILNTRVTLTCSQPLTGMVSVKYAGNAVGDKNHRGIGNLRDSDRYRSLYTYAEDSGEVSSVGTAADYHPVDENGSLLTNRPYPLQNWASHSYHQIIVDSIPAQDFSFRISSTSAGIGDVLDLSCRYIPSNANSGLEIVWSVSDRSKAVIEKDAVTILGGSDGDLVTITGTLANGVSHSMDICIQKKTDPYAAYYGYWDFANGDSANTTTVKNLVTKEQDAVLVGVDGTNSGYLTGDGLTLAANSAVRLPVSGDLPSGVEIFMDFTLPENLYTSQTINNKSFVALVNGSANRLEFGTERWGIAWPALRGVASTATTEAELAWRYITDKGGTPLGNSKMWISSSTLHQYLRLRMSSDGSGEFAMKCSTDESWRTWELPTYGVDSSGKVVTYPNFRCVRDACDAILIGNRSAMTYAAPGTVIHRVYLKEYNG